MDFSNNKSSLRTFSPQDFPIQISTAEKVEVNPVNRVVLWRHEQPWVPRLMVPQEQRCDQRTVVGLWGEHRFWGLIHQNLTLVLIVIGLRFVCSVSS